MRFAMMVLGLLSVMLSCTMTSAQPRRLQPAMRGGFNAQPLMVDLDGDIETDADEGEPAQDGGATPIKPGLRPKTPLGRYISALDFRRDPDAVLRARAKLAAQDREALLNPPDTKDDDQPAEIEDSSAMFGDQIAAPFTRSQIDEAAIILPQQNVLPAANNGEIAQPTSVNPMDPAQPNSQEDISDAGIPAPAKRLTKGEQRNADRFRLQVVGGDWPSVRAFLATSAGDDAAAIYQCVLVQLAGDSAIVPDEIIAIADASPGELTDTQVAALGQLLKAAVHRGADAGHVGSVITKGTRHFGGPEPAGRERAASLLMSAGLPVEAQPFLDPLDRARKDKNAKLLNLHAMYFQGLSIRKTDAIAKSEMVKQSWDLCLEVLAIASAPAPERTAALRRAISFLDEIPPEHGEAWLRSVVQSSPDLCWALVQRVNQQARTAKAQMRPAEDRVKLLKRVKRVGTAIVDNAGKNLPQYRAALDMMSMAIVDELEFTKQMQQMPQRDNEHVQIVPSERLSECLPTAAWLRAGDAGLAARLELMTAGVVGGSGDIQAVLEMVRPLVQVDRARAQKIADSVVIAWPNYVQAGGGGDDEYGGGGGYRRGRGYGGGYGMYGGYNSYGGGNEGGIPLTRAKQKRNLEQLGELLDAFKSFGLASPEEVALITAFSASHSDAEVFAEDDVRAVFGPLESLPSPVATNLADSMRRRLATIWRSTQVQQQSNTKRNDKQIAAEVLRGYDLAAKLANRAKMGDERSWRAALLNADLQFDMAEFLYGQKVDLATYSAMRERSFAAYADAAGRYLDELHTGKSQPSSMVYFHWLSSSLGASDLGFLTRQDQPDDDQVDRVVASIDKLPQALRAKHIGLFANEVTTALQTIAPELKVRFLTHACRVIGDHPDGVKASKQLEYYTDLKTEVELRLTVDGGGTTVGSREPFGAQLSIWSTRAVSRESGGFSKYIQNQQYNPMTAQPVDYKDDFEKKLRDVLGERFNIVSITFHKPGARPMGTPRDGWEQHPLAYLLLSPKDESVDRIPPIKLDLDFSDSGGIVIFPVTSTVQLIDARTEPSPGARTPMNIEIEQVLDARESLQRRAKLEIRAKGDGLIPELSELLDVRIISDLSVIKIDDHGTTILDLETTGDTVIPKCERTWTLDLASSSTAPITAFAFPALQPNISSGSATPKVMYKQYDDADIKECAAVVPINMTGPKPASLYIWLIVTVGILAMLALGWYIFVRKRKVAEHTAPRFTLPTNLTPVNAISTLRRIASIPGLGLADSEHTALAGTITEIEIKYFGPSRPQTSQNGEAAHDLRPMVERWITLAEKRIAP